MGGFLLHTNPLKTRGKFRCSGKVNVLYFCSWLKREPIWHVSVMNIVENHRIAASRWQTLLMEEIRLPSVNHQPAASHWKTLLLEESLHKMYALFCVSIGNPRWRPPYWIFIRRPSRDGPYYVIGYGGRPHRFPHNNFISLYRIFTKLGHMIPMWKGKNPIYFGIIRSKVKVTVTINIIFDNMVVWTTW